jgi:uncharacterized protein (TIGR02145 family)
MILVLLFLLPLIIHSQAIGTVSGKLVDQNGNGLSGLQLNLYISPNIYQTMSLSNGSFSFVSVTGIKEEQLPTGYEISNNYPNPFNPKTRISITLPKSCDIKVEVFNLLGQMVREVNKKSFGAGNNFIDLELNGLTNGFYLARITLDEKFTVTKKLMLIYGSQHLSSSGGNLFSRLNKTTLDGNSILDTKIDSLVVTGISIVKKIFTNLPNMIGNSLNLGNLTIPASAPPVPTLSIPINGANDIPLSPILNWNKCLTAINYNLQVSTKSDFTSFVYNQNGLTSTAQQITGLSYFTTYYWRVSATNNYGTSAWSNYFSFNSIGTAPQPPALLVPANGSTGTTTSPILSWNASNHTTSYTLQVSTNNSFTSFVYNQSVGSNINQQINGLNNLTTYYWRVSATNNYGTSGWSDKWSFMTALPTPTLSSPVDGATEVSLTPTFFWNISNTATNYTLQVSRYSDFSTFIYNQSGLTNTNQQISGLNNFTKYYWRVNAINSFGTSSWSNTWSFNTIGTTPQPPTLLSPINDATNVSTSPILSWISSSNATSYTLQVSENDSFTNLVYNQSGLTNTSLQIFGISNSKKYFWRVLAINSYGISGWSSSWSFTTIVTVPFGPTLSSPSDGTIQAPLSLILYWNVSNTATSYTLQVSTNSLFSTFVYNQSGLTNTNQQISGLNNFTKYYWRVNAINSFGTSSWSNTWSFITLSVPCPGIPTVIYAGKTYNTVKIGNQCWLKENLNVGIRINGNSNQTNNSIIEKYCYNDDETICNIYGGLYQWAEAVQYLNGATNNSLPNPPFSGTIQGLCPTGWHIPSNSELQTLATALDNNSNGLKALGQGTENGIGTNSSGFSALLGGVLYNTNYFDFIGRSTSFLSSTSQGQGNGSISYSPAMGLYFSDSTIYLYDAQKWSGISIRCVKNE